MNDDARNYECEDENSVYASQILLYLSGPSISLRILFNNCSFLQNSNVSLPYKMMCKRYAINGTYAETSTGTLKACD
jgi:hypothetical protein